ncbi:ATP-binding cassette sub-family G member 5-like [Varroa jacobsoni]|uniref:ABC transporter domain-containing protein n=1 Tax=Varroa destructor TaxID=109461 RepID=A0A7M7JD30_VARDE|nr:ATP-binding cassette sub-family G member 5-like isoform X3 [Varroa destructor]XP_022698115.1 ATP-binding cassette sub-family G member 5-like [Varroa jacobsoni]
MSSKSLQNDIDESSMATDHIVELVGIHYTGPVQTPSCVQSLTGTGLTAPLIKDVSLEVHAGEVMAVLGSKGSGKKALLEVIARRAMGPTRGQILLNDIPITVRLFQEQCGYVPRRVNLVPGLTVRQSLDVGAQLTVGSKVPASVKKARVKQVMADLALNGVADREVSTLSINEQRRLAIGLELVRDPVLVILDEPTADLDPLNTYFVVSILANHAKKYNRIVLMSLSKPRSDIFPFLDRVTYLCLGELVYTGSTRHMLDYFRNVGFPCPEMENPLMYYLCLSTVDRRTRERFLESSSQIQSLVEKFRIEGARYRKIASGAISDATPPPPSDYKLPLTAYGQPSSVQVFAALYGRFMASSFNFNWRAIRDLGFRTLVLPAFFAFMLCFFHPLRDSQQSFFTRNGLILSAITATSFLSAAITAITYAPHRTRYYQESREGKYRGPLFVFTHALFSMPMSIFSVFAAASIIYGASELRPQWERWAPFCAILWCCYAFAEQQTVALMMVIRSSYTACVTSIYFLAIYITLASGGVKSLVVMPDWAYYASYGVMHRYAGAFLYQNEFENYASLDYAPSINGTSCGPNVEPGRCYFVSGSHFISQKYRTGRGTLHVDLQYWLNFGLSFGFIGAMYLVNVILHIIPLPASVKIKFRD